MRAKAELYVRAAALGVLLFSGGIAASPPVDLGEILGYEAALEIDAKGVAMALGISPEDARRRLNVQEHSGIIVQRLRKQYE